MTIKVSSIEINHALSETLEAILEGIKVCLERTPRELVQI